MKKVLKITSGIIVFIVVIISIALYVINKPRLIASSYSKDNNYILSFIETDSPIFFGSSKVKIELKSNDEEIMEKQEINTEIANDGKNLDYSNWKVDWENDHVEITLIGEEQADKIIKIYYIKEENLDIK